MTFSLAKSVTFCTLTFTYTSTSQSLTSPGGSEHGGLAQQGASEIISSHPSSLYRRRPPQRGSVHMAGTAGARAGLQIWSKGRPITLPPAFPQRALPGQTDCQCMSQSWPKTEVFQTHRHRGQTSVARRGRGRMGCEFGVSICKLVHTGRISNVVLLYSTGGYI